MLEHKISARFGFSTPIPTLHTLLHALLSLPHQRGDLESCWDPQSRSGW